MNRREFLKGMFCASVVASTPVALASKLSESERERCRRDIIYFAEQYCRINGKKVTLHEAQKKYLLHLLDNFDDKSKGVVWCQKCRQSGVSTMNAIFAKWYISTHDECIIEIYSPNKDNAQATLDSVTVEVDKESSLPPLFNEDGYWVTPNTSLTCADSYDGFLHSNNGLRENIIIFDDYAFVDKEVSKKVLTHLVNDRMKVCPSSEENGDDGYHTKIPLIIFSSTPTSFNGNYIQEVCNKVKSPTVKIIRDSDMNLRFEIKG